MQSKRSNTGRGAVRSKPRPNVAVQPDAANPTFLSSDILAQTRAFATPFLATEVLESGQNSLAHSDAVVAILAEMEASASLQAAVYLVYAAEHLTRPEEVIGKVFGTSLATLAIETMQLMRVQKQARKARAGAQLLHDAAVQTENVRKMLLAFSRDTRVIMLRLASRLETLRYCTREKRAILPSLAHESLHVFAPLANRLGIWQVKWEMEDLAFRFLDPVTYREVATLLDQKRRERVTSLDQLRNQVEAGLAAQAIQVNVQGRPKHIYSIVRKMQGKKVGFDGIFDIRALRVIAKNIDDCYAVLSYVHTQFSPVVEEFSDYIAKPKVNGYQSLHTVVRDGDDKPIEIQIRTQAMHDHAEHGVAAHWAYKEAGSKGYAGVTANSDYDAKIAVLRQLLAWERDMVEGQQQSGLFEDRIYVLTPDAAIVELPQGATPLDFAYSVHTNIGHRCRGAHVDGVMVALNTPLQNGQTVAITTVKEGGPSRDWLNPDLGYLASHRAKAKVRAWLNAQTTQATILRGREAVEKLLQREGKTSVKLEELATRLGFKSADALFEVVGKDEFSLRNIETLLRPAEPSAPTEEQSFTRKPRATAKGLKNGVLVVGLDSLMTQLAKCCKPAPPDAIGGFVTRGKGVSVHRLDCSNFREMQVSHYHRIIEVQWGAPKLKNTTVYPVDINIQAADRQGLLRDILEIFSREKINMISVQTQTVKNVAWMTLTVEVSDAARLSKVVELVCKVDGVKMARRK